MYRTPQTDRISRQTRDTIFRHAGQTATWRQYISASAGTPVAGLGDESRYREQTITALFGHLEQPESQTPAGTIITAAVTAVTREQLSRNDELIWRGIEFRIESDPAPAKIAGTFVSILRRAD
jgi:hypothetical protein